MSSSITIKTQYGGDIRRFNVDPTANGGSLFATIQSSISSLYRLAARSFTINYIDEEGDACVCSGDEETREALRFAGDHGRVLKLNVVVNDTNASGAATPAVPVVEPATPKAAAPIPSPVSPVSPVSSVSSSLETKKPVIIRPHVSFVGDVTIEDGSIQVGGTTIIKTWTIKNTNGNGRWPMTVAIVSVAADGRVSPVSDAIAHITAGTTDSGNVSVPINVPTTAGRHKFEYHIVTADGERVDGDYQLWADFIVRAPMSASFVSDVTIEDGSEIAGNSTVKKVWRIKNDGTMTWPAGSLLVHNDGTVIPSPLFPIEGKGIAVPCVLPGETVDISMHVLIPSASGRHHGEFHLYGPNGEKFANDYALWTQVRVPVPVLSHHDIISLLPKWMQDASIRTAIDKLRIGHGTANASTSTSSSDVVHTGITCDGCGQFPLVGVRMKCASCADYDLCASCETKSLANGGINGHNGEHCFIKIKVPVTPRGHGHGRRLESKATSSVNWRVAPGATSEPVPASPAASSPGVPSSIAITLGKVVPRAVKKTVPRAQFKADITLPDGAQVICGSIVVKRWSITNIGEDVWPIGTQLMFVGGALQPASPTSSEPLSLSTVPLAVPNATVDVWARVQIPNVAGRHTGYFRLATNDGKRFGHRLWLDIVAVNDTTKQLVGTTPTPVVVSSNKLEVKVNPVPVAVAVMPTPSAPTMVVAATPSVAAVAAAVPAKVNKYVTELAQLKELGYRDEDMLIELLAAAGGRVSQVVDWLVTPVV